MPSLETDEALEQTQNEALQTEEAPGEETAKNDRKNKSKKKKKKKKMKPLQIAQPRPNHQRRKRKNNSSLPTTNPNTENPLSSLQTLDQGTNRLRFFVMFLNGVMVPLSSFLGMAVHGMALLGALQLDLSLLLPALIYFTAIWCLWSLSMVTQPTFLIVLYPFLMAAQGRLIYSRLVQQMEQQQAAFEELSPMFADQLPYKDSDEDFNDDNEDLSPQFEQTDVEQGGAAEETK